MDRKEIEATRKEMEKVADVDYRDKLLFELKEYEESRFGPNYKTEVEERITSWKEEAQHL